MSSSLQQALSAAPTSSRTGGFESCFAQGLDLSEFQSRAGSSATPTSASAALLSIKASESLKKQENEKEEIRMKEILQKRLVAVNASLERGDEPSKATKQGFLQVKGGLAGAIVCMHGNDKSEQRTTKRSAGNSRRFKAKESSSKRSGPVKKSKRGSKY
jgi:hypothetical protein